MCHVQCLLKHTVAMWNDNATYNVDKISDMDASKTMQFYL